MQEFAYLLFYIVIAAALLWVLNLRGMGSIRRLFDRFLNATTSGLSLMTRFSEIGTDRKFEKQGHTAYHSSSRGLRLIATALTGLALWYWLTLSQTNNIAGVTVQSNPPSFVTIALVLLIVGYYLIYIWTYQVKITDTELTVPTYHLTTRSYDLTQLNSVEDDGAYSLRLYFRDGRRAEVLKYVTGQLTFRRRLEDTVKNNL